MSKIIKNPKRTNLLHSGEYHTPYVKSLRDSTGSLFYFDADDNYLTLSDAVKISAASCASISYRTEGMTLEKAEKIFDMLIKAEAVHSSPFEHLATPVKPKYSELGCVRVNS